MGADRLLCFAPQAASCGSPYGRLGPWPVRRFTGPSHDGHALSGPTPTFPETKKYQGEPGIFLSMVEMVGVEPTSESISAGISPSAVNVLKFRFSGRPLTGCRSGYPVSPLKYREIPQSFPV